MYREDYEDKFEEQDEFEEQEELTERDLQDALRNLIEGHDVDKINWYDVRVNTFEEEGVMTHNKGLVFKLPDGTEFQVTIVQSW